MTCFVCGSDNNALIFDRIREGPRDVRRCAACGFVWLGPVAAGIKTGNDAYYNSAEYASRCYDTNWSFEERKEKRRQSLSLTIESLARHIGDNSVVNVLEIGASVGAVAEVLASRFPRVRMHGVEVNREEARYLSGILGEGRVFTSIGEAAESGLRFDFIYGIHVFEHFEEPRKELAALHSLLSEKGRIFLEMPNHDDFYLAALHGSHLQNYREFMYHKAHPFYYSRNSFVKTVEGAGMTVERVETRQDYPVVNFFHWLLNGGPQKNIAEATSFGVREDNETAMELMKGLDRSFRDFVEARGAGCTLVAMIKA